MANTRIPDHSKVASNTCIYWKISDSNDPNSAKRCFATDFFPSSSISCHNTGLCNLSGTCKNCTAYDVGGLKLSHKDTTQVYVDTYLSEWSEEQKKYIPVRKLRADEVAGYNKFSESPTALTSSQRLTSYNFAAVQTPINISIYNLRAKFKKCCNWHGDPFEFSKDRNGNILATTRYKDKVYTVQYLRLIETQDGDNIIVSKAATPYVYLYKSASFPMYLNVCSVQEAIGWVTPFSSQNPTSYGCNGCKPECPYYTGPKWSHCVDSKMETGDRVSASQIMELRYYSADWKNMVDPEDEWFKRFREPVIWAWTGGFTREGASGTAVQTTDAPMVKKVYISDFRSEEPTIATSKPVPAEWGIIYRSEDRPLDSLTTNYPTLIKEISEIYNGVKIVWPKGTAKNPFKFRTFISGQNKVNVYVDSPYTTSDIYGINLTKHPQYGMSDSEFLSSIAENYPDDLKIAERMEFSITDSSTGNQVSFEGDFMTFEIDLEYQPEVNAIKIFVRNPYYSENTSSTAEATTKTSIVGGLEYFTDTCYVNHKFYHAMVAQTKGYDLAGYNQAQPWLDRFEHVYTEADIMHLTSGVSLYQVLWDTHAAGKKTFYSVEKLTQNELQEDWFSVGCDYIAVTMSNVECNSVTPWYVSGVSVHGGISLGLYVDRSGNPKVTGSDTLVLLDVINKSADGSGIPGNVVFARPSVSKTTPYRRLSSISSPFDPRYDKVYATYTTTEYKQGPIPSEDYSILRYPEEDAYCITQMPVSITQLNNGTSFSAEGSFVEIYKVNNDLVTQTEKVFDINDIKDEIYLGTRDAESQSVSSFARGGVSDDSIKTHTQAYDVVVNRFNEKYNGYRFVSDGASVSLSELCRRLQDLRLHEGAYQFLVIFKDEEGRPIGAKRMAMLLQSAHAETRDVEIYYEWEKELYEWPIVDSMLLLAKFNLPARRGSRSGSESYKPKCGDHSETFMNSHFFGDPGPMWYPYIACNEPRYHEDYEEAAVKCKNYVEGFGGEYEGKRWSYWERMRGPDKLTTWIAGSIFVVGCFYNEVSSTYAVDGVQVFKGYTRIRSGHPQGPYAKDREAIHLNRHFIKRNLKVVDELVAREGDGYSTEWSEAYGQLLFVPGTTSERVGSQREAAIWVHLSDGVSEVSSTTYELQHPYTHYILKSVGDISYNETFSSVRHKLSDVLQDRDLTSTAVRRTDGTLVYRPKEPDYASCKQSYSDVVPVFTDKDTAWAWLEAKRDVVRSAPQINGISLYNPSATLWRKDRESATFMDEGSHKVYYKAPVFNVDGSLSRAPSVGLDDGPERVLNWYTGLWNDTGNTPYNYAFVNGNKRINNFALFGEDSTSSSSSFLIDGSGLQKYVASITNDGATYGSTCRGLGVNSKVNVQELPYSLTDLFVDVADLKKDIKIANTALLAGNAAFVGSSSIGVSLRGYYYVESVEITCRLGMGRDNTGVERRFDIPAITVDLVVSITEDGVSRVAAPIAKEYVRTAYKYSTTASLYETEGTEGTVFTYNGNGYMRMKRAVGGKCDHIKIGFGPLRADALAYIENIRVWYRKPINREESIQTYERRVNISQANSGTPDYRNMLYYYNRAVPSFGDDLSYTFTDVENDSPTIKWTSRSVKDVVLEYEYLDPTATRFAYKPEIKPENNPGTYYDADNYLAYAGDINICTKSRTLVAGAHVNDCPHYVLVGGRTEVNSNNVSSNETATLCKNYVGNRKLDETAQECLYSTARSLIGNDLETTFEWFWHPDEQSFWLNSVGLDITKFTKTLVLRSCIPPLNRVWEHEQFGCSSSLSVPYYDGRVHAIDKWSALGHRIYAGDPRYNWSCYDVVVVKREDHMGESLYGTAAYASNASVVKWPEMTLRDNAYYVNKNIVDNTSSYIGGSIGGAGVMFWAAQAALSHGLTTPQMVTWRETQESIISSTEKATRADASRRGFHSDEEVMTKEEWNQKLSER